MQYEVLHGYHDAALNTIESGLVAGELTLHFTSSMGEKKVITLHGCEIFRITDFVAQNIVSRIVIYRGGAVNVLDVREKLIWASSLSDSSSFLEPERLNVILSNIKNEGASLLFLEPSCGAELVALYRDFTVHSHTPVQIKSAIGDTLL